MVNKMKICNHCGSENEDGAKFCFSCGNKIEIDTSNQSQLDYNPNNDNINQQQDNNSYNNQQPNNNVDYQPPNNQPTNQQNPYQPNYPVTNTKNAWIAIILNFIGGVIFYFLASIGHLYLGLYKRAIVLALIGLGIVLINAVILMLIYNWVGSLLTLLLGIAFVIYCAYDAYLCTDAINQGRPMPLLFGMLDIQ